MICFSKSASMPMSVLSTLFIALPLAGLPVVHAPAQAQTQPPPVQRTDPADPKAAIPTVAYRSSLSRYPAFTATEVAPWRETNEVVRQRGGWRAYARESQVPPSTAAPSTAAPSPAAHSASTPAAPAKPVMRGHAGHEMK